MCETTKTEEKKALLTAVIEAEELNTINKKGWWEGRREKEREREGGARR